MYLGKSIDTALGFLQVTLRRLQFCRYLTCCALECLHFNCSILRHRKAVPCSPFHMRPPIQDLSFVILEILYLSWRGSHSRHCVSSAAQLVASPLLLLAPQHLPFKASNQSAVSSTPGFCDVTRPLLCLPCVPPLSLWIHISHSPCVLLPFELVTFVPKAYYTFPPLQPVLQVYPATALPLLCRLQCLLVFYPLVFGL
jgi:hypothetical protein